MIRYVTGDLFAPEHRAIGHGCNCRGHMGAGVAAVVRREFPEAFRQYASACAMGNLVPGSLDHWHAGDRHVFNLATQLDPGADARLDAIESSVKMMLRLARVHGLAEVAIPWLGCGIGGLTRAEVGPVLDTAAASVMTVDLVVVAREGDS